METFEIANLHVRFDARGELLYTRTRPYLAKEPCEPDFTIDLSEEFFAQKHEQYPLLTLDECRYMWVGEAFYARLLRYDGMLLHASCVEKDGVAYLFSAKSGTGKSTHTHLWLRAFPGTRIINDDKPALRRIDGTFYACGTPFSGKTDESVNVQVPVRAIVFIERGTENSIEPIPPATSIPLFMSQTLRPPKKEAMEVMLTLLGDLLEAVPVFRLRCNMEMSAAKTAFAGVEKYCNEKE